MFNSDIFKGNVLIWIWKWQVNFIFDLFFKKAVKLLNKFKHETKHLRKITTVKVFNFFFFSLQLNESEIRDPLSSCASCGRYSNIQ